MLLGRGLTLVQIKRKKKKKKFAPYVVSGSNPEIVNIDSHWRLT